MEEKGLMCQLTGFWDRANMAQVSCANWGSSLKEVVFRCDTNIKCN